MNDVDIMVFMGNEAKVIGVVGGMLTCPQEGVDTKRATGRSYHSPPHG